MLLGTILPRLRSWYVRESTLSQHVGVGMVVASGSLGRVILNTLARNARDVGSIPTLGAIFITSMTQL